MILKKRNRDLATYTALSVVSRVFNVISVLQLARAMLTSEFGKIAFLQASAMLICTFATMNLQTPLTVALAKGTRDPRKENTIIAYLISIVVLFSTCGVAISFAFFPIVAFSRTQTLLYYGFTALTSSQFIATTVLVARGRKLFVSASTAIVNSLLCLTLRQFESLSLSEALWTTTGAVALTSLLLCAAIYCAGIDGDLIGAYRAGWAYLQRQARHLVSFAILSFCGSLTIQIGLWFLQRQLISVGGPDESAIFALGTQFYNVVLFLPSVMGSVLLRELSNIENNDLRFRSTTNAIFMSCGLAFGGLVFFGLTSHYILSVLPTKYSNQSGAITLAVTAGAFTFAKFPASVFFQSRIAALPELVSGVAAASILVLGAINRPFISSAVNALELRAFALFVQFMIVLSWFACAYLAVRFEGGAHHSVRS